MSNEERACVAASGLILSMKSQHAPCGSAEVEDPELLGVLDADLLAELDGVLRQELLEERDPLVELALVRRERGDLRVEEAGDVLDVVRLVRPAEPDVGTSLTSRPSTSCSEKKCGLPAPGNTASSAIAPAVRWSEWL